MAKFKTVKRKAEVGERILIVDADSPYDTYRNGDVFTVTKIDDVFVFVAEHGTLIFSNEYEVIIENEMEAGEMKTRYDLAIEKAREAIEELRLAAYEQGYKDATHDLTAKAPVSFAEAYTGIQLRGYQKVAAERLKSPQQIRDEIVERAKRDVAELIARGKDDSPMGGKEGNEIFRKKYYTVEFVINREKRTIVALIHVGYFGISQRNASRGIAKCAPNDCFNSHIGKVIALRRALGLEVPSEYLQAPQPTEVRVGDVVKMPRGGAYTCKYNHSDIKKFPNHSIIDDSREGVGE